MSDSLVTKCFVPKTSIDILKKYFTTGIDLQKDQRDALMIAEEQRIFTRALYPERFEGDSVPPAVDPIEPDAADVVEDLPPVSQVPEVQGPTLLEVKEEDFEEVFYSKNRAMAMEEPIDTLKRTRAPKLSASRGKSGSRPPRTWTASRWRCSTPCQNRPTLGR